MRASIIAWSAFSGLLLGIFLDLLLMGVWGVATTIVPALASRVPLRVGQPAVVALLALAPVALGVLGALEGRLKG